MTPNEIRDKYLNYFAERDHTLVPSASLVPENDPSLLFTGAGMNQFKDEFLGKGHRGLTRATTSQKCLRTGDLDNVGRTAGHHSFFEMLGNFSFGDYFKREAILWAWDFLVSELRLDGDRLRVTVYEEDEEAYAIWRDEVGVPEDRIYRLGAKENFWPADAPKKGPNGPCGPCSEIFFDYGPVDGPVDGPGDGPEAGCPDPAACDPSCDCNRYIEVWNLVFTQFERKDGGELVPLPQKSIDTGAGFERLVAVTEGKHATMDTSLFRPLVEAVAQVAGRDGYDPSGEDGVRQRRIADHVRAGCFLVGDGVRPGNEGRGYVLRRILRRAIRDGHGLGIEGPFLSRLVAPVADAMGDAYPDLRSGVDLLVGVLNAEEEQFRKTFRAGLRRLETALQRLEEKGGDELSAETVFQLHDTFGFPVDITAEILDERGVRFSREGYDRLMEEQRVRARGAAKITDDIFERGPLGELAQGGVPQTQFTGYGDSDSTEPRTRQGVLATARLVAVLTADLSSRLEALPPDQDVVVVLDRTPFYAESGGQVGDGGSLRFEGGVFQVSGTVANIGYTLHRGRFEGEGAVSPGDSCTAQVDPVRRDAVRRNHTGTHLLHRALKDVLGTGVQQAGSAVGPDRLRFDFTLDRGVTPEEIVAIEAAVNREILRNERIETLLMSVAEAKSSGAVALFGEAYPEPVRVVAVGDYSRELCGGTHCGGAGDIGSFRIVSESSVAAGIRRVEAVTGAEAVLRMQGDRAVVVGLSRTLGVPVKDVSRRIGKLLEDLRESRKRKPPASEGPAFEPLGGDPVRSGGMAIHVHLLDRPREELLAAGNALVKRVGDAAATLMVTTAGGKIAAVAAGNPAAVEAGFDAAALIRGTGGRGGGKKPLAQGTYPGKPTATGLQTAVTSFLT